MVKLTLKEQVQRVREDAIIASVNRLLATKGYDQMTVDEVAQDVGVAKASLYRHFGSKEELAATAMVRTLVEASNAMDQIQVDAKGDALARLKAIAAWAMQVHLQGRMPTLPTQNSSLRNCLVRHSEYLRWLNEVSDRLGEWILQAQAEGSISNAYPPELVLYGLYARACDPVLGVLKATGQYSDEQIVDLLSRLWFEGVSARP